MDMPYVDDHVGEAPKAVDTLFFKFYGTLPKRLLWMACGTVIVQVSASVAPIWFALLILTMWFAPLMLHMLGTLISVLLIGCIASRLPLKEGTGLCAKIAIASALEDGLTILLIANLGNRILS